MRARFLGGHQSGLTLVEVIVATAIFAVGSVAAAHLLVWAARALWASGAETTAVAAAQEKLEELQSAAWRFDVAGNRISAAELATSPPHTISANISGYVDYLNEHGQPIGSGPGPPSSAAYVRRWAVRPLATAPDDTLVLQVVVVPLANGDRALGPATSGRGPGESLLTTARTRVR
jgi:prepilin-type N-terminal cleavage/methylation domain-containing protein